MRCPPFIRLVRPALILLVMGLLSLFAAAPAAADGIIIPAPPPGRPIPWREIPLTIKYHRVATTIADQVAVTRVDQVFVNEAGFAVEGTYIFPLPEEAAISSFDMWVDGRKIEGRLLDREEARAIYEEIVRKQRDPALLEYVGRGAFQASIFPIPPAGERRIELTYSQVLPQAAGLVHYRYPLNTEKFSARLINEVTISVQLAAQAPLAAIYSPSHPVTVTREAPSRATIRYTAANVRPDRDFDLYYSLAGNAIEANVLSYKPYDEDGFFLLLIAPPIEAAPARAIDRDVIIVLDTSGSMAGEKLVQAQAAARFVLDHLGEGDRFNIVSFGTFTRLFADRPVALSRRDEARGFIGRLTAQGSTDINRALLEALAGADPARPTVLLFLTDGLPTIGETDPERIVDNVTRAAAKSVRLFAFGVGNDVDAVLLDQLSGALRGTSVYVRPGQKIDEAVSDFYGRINVPVLLDVRLAVEGVHVEDMYPYPLPDLFAGNQLVVAGRYRAGGPATVRLSGTVAGAAQTFTYRVAFTERGGEEFIAPLWAQRKVGYLLAQIRLNGPKEELVKEVVALSTRYGIITPYTSFLVQEPQLALTQSGRDQLGRDALQPPAGPMAAPALAAAPRSGEPAVERAVVEQALKDAERPAPAAAPQVRQVGAKTFLRQGDLWLDTLFDPGRMSAEAILFGSERYFQLLARHPEIGRYLALGDRLVVVLEGKAYAIGSTGQESPGEHLTPRPPSLEGYLTPRPPSLEGYLTPRPPSLEGKGEILSPPLVGEGSGERWEGPSRPPAPPISGGTEGGETGGESGGLPLCPGAGFIALAGAVLPMWTWRRRGRG